MSEENQETLQPSDFQPSGDVTIQPPYFRELIAGLRALPNAADVAVARTVAELDRIASHFERADRSRELLFAAALKLAELWIAEKKIPAHTIDVMKRTGGIPTSIMMQLMDDVMGDRPPSPNCNCPRCASKRAQAENQGSTATIQ